MLTVSLASDPVRTVELFGEHVLPTLCRWPYKQSRRAALPYGFTFEGVFRQHLVVKDRNRDSAWFSILDGEWPRIRAGFEAWLAPENFDADGRQRQSLSEIRATLDDG